MFVPLLLLTLPLRPVDFPATPIAGQLDEGVRVYRYGRGLDRLYQADRQSTGTWFDGKRKQGVDYVLWLSPSLISRWLGYLEAKEKWPSGELERRWERIRQDLGGRMTFIVRSCSMPRIDALEGEIAQPAPTLDAASIRFLWTSSPSPLPSVAARLPMVGLIRGGEPALDSSRRVPPGLRIEPSVCLVGERWSRLASEVLREDWWQRVPFGEPLRPELDSPDSGYRLPLGEFYSATHLVTLPLPATGWESPEFELRTFRPGKEQVARFSLFQSKVAGS